MGEAPVASDRGLLTPDDVWGQWEREFTWAKADAATRPLYPLLYHFAVYIKAKCIVEVGIGRAMGCFVFGMYAKLYGADYCCIDLANHCVRRARVTAERWDFPTVVLQYDSKAIAWYSKHIDLLFIDGGHRYEQTLGDIDNFVPWVRRNGLIFFHCYDNKRWEVKQAVEERFDPEKYEQMHLPYNSLGVMLWRVK